MRRRTLPRPSASPAPRRSRPPAGGARSPPRGPLDRRSTPTRGPSSRPSSRRCSPARCPPSGRERAPRSRRPSRTSIARSRACPPPRRPSSAQLFALLALPPARRAFAGVAPPWHEATRRRGRRVPRSLARQRLGAEAQRLRRAAPARSSPRGTAIRARGRHRLSRPAEDRLSDGRRRIDRRRRCGAHVSPTRSAPASRPAGRSSTPRARRRPRRSSATSASSAAARAAASTAEILAARGPARRHRRGRPAAHLVATSTCASARPIPSSTRSRRRARPRDKAINILQGRCVGGGTTVNWTSSFRTPARDARALGTRVTASRLLGRATLRAVVRAHGGAPVDRALARCRRTQNNAALARGAAKLGIPSAIIRRNVQGCANLGYCGVGLPDEREAVDAGDDDPGGARPRRDARHARARAAPRRSRAIASTALECSAMDAGGTAPTGAHA